MGAFSDYCIVFVFLPSLVLQGVAFFTPNWVTERGITTRGLFYRCDFESSNDTCSFLPSDDQYINQHVVGLQASALVMLFLSCLSVLCIINFLRDDNTTTSLALAVFRLFGCLMIFLYPVAGVLISVGCILVIADHVKDTVGYSFFLSIGTAAYIILKCIVIIVCCYYCTSGDKEADDEELHSQRGSQSNVSRRHFEKDTEDNDASSEAQMDTEAQKVKPGFSAVLAAARMKQLIRLNK